MQFIPRLQVARRKLGEQAISQLLPTDGGGRNFVRRFRVIGTGDDFAQGRVCSEPMAGAQKGKP